MECNLECLMNLGSDAAVILAFIFTGITFLIVFRRNRKDEQIKTALEIQKQLSESDLLLTDTLLKFKNSTSVEDAMNPQNVYDSLKTVVIKHFNNWEWFAVLVNKKEIKQGYIKEHFKNRFIRECREILSKFYNLENEEQTTYKETKLLYKKWKTEGN